MTLSPEQFNQLVTKKEHLELKNDVKEIDKKVDQILDVLSTVVDTHKKHDQEMTANQAAHDRFENRISKLEKSTVN